MKRVIINADDFGLALPVNDAIVEAHRRGILASASLMVGAEAAADAIERARRLPTLRVGLHVVLVEGRSILPPRAIPKLVNVRGEFECSPLRAGLKYAFSPGIREQMASEIRAQFEAFRATGLELDHADTHNHLHLHPRILNLILEVGRDFGLTAVRFLNEPPRASWRASRRSGLARMLSWIGLSPIRMFMRRRLRRAGVRHNDFTFGMADSGGMSTDLVLRILENLPEGSTEVFFHPATSRSAETDRTMPSYCHVEEFQTLTNDRVRTAFESAGIQRISFRDL
jgi:hopanoid biosynthesis associated protein HpnK